uniref:Uncharacterized protein n=1 Tax=Aegilops tauschii subsp. strangulata TaxID=200361 RepID=A0A453JXR3_AEGTS
SQPPSPPSPNRGAPAPPNRRARPVAQSHRRAAASAPSRDLRRLKLRRAGQLHPARRRQLPPRLSSQQEGRTQKRTSALRLSPSILVPFSSCCEEVGSTYKVELP